MHLVVPRRRQAPPEVSAAWASPTLSRVLAAVCPYPWGPLPAGYSLRWLAEPLIGLDDPKPPARTSDRDPPWHVLGPGDRAYRCRAGAAPGRKACGAPAVACLFRQGAVPWWGYCPGHLAEMDRAVHSLRVWRRVIRDDRVGVDLSGRHLRFAG